MDTGVIFFFSAFALLFFLLYFLNQNIIKRDHELIYNKIQQYVVKKFVNLKGEIIRYSFIDSELNQKIYPSEYDLLFCDFGLVILSKNYKPIITLYNQKNDCIKDLKINRCNYIKHKTNALTKKIELQVCGIGNVTRIKMIITPSEKGVVEEISALIESMIKAIPRNNLTATLLARS